MNKLLLSLLVSLCVVSVVSAFSEEQYQNAFVQFIGQYNKKYSHDNFFGRYKVFKANLDFISEHNSGNSSFSVAMNEFGDLTSAEFAATHTGRQPSRRLGSETVIGQPGANPASVDWRTQKVVTGVKNQGSCGSCWSFATTGSIEGAWAIKGNTLVSLSEQQLVDCSTKQGNGGCNGGLSTSAYKYVIANKGITGETDYPYTARNGNCQTGKPARATISNYKTVTANSDADLENAVAIVTVSVAIEADKSSFQFYSGGVYSDAGCGTNLDHEVLAVGYNTNGNTKYWIVKNSWGTSWGLSGYIYIARVAGKGICGINMDACYPII